MCCHASESWHPASYAIKSLLERHWAPAFVGVTIYYLLFNFTNNPTFTNASFIATLIFTCFLPIQDQLPRSARRNPTSLEPLLTFDRINSQRRHILSETLPGSSGSRQKSDSVFCHDWRGHPRIFTAAAATGNALQPGFDFQTIDVPVERIINPQNAEHAPADECGLRKSDFEFG